MQGDKLLRGLGWALGIVAAVALVLIMAFSVLVSFAFRDTTPRGSLPDPATWPKGVRQLRDDMQSANIDTSGFEVYLVHGKPGSDLSTVLCRMPDTSQSFEFLTQRLELKPPEGSRSGCFKVGEEVEAPPGWWPSSSKDTQMFISRNIWKELEADLYFVAHDTAQKRTYILYEFNF